MRFLYYGLIILAVITFCGSQSDIIFPLTKQGIDPIKRGFRPETLSPWSPSAKKFLKDITPHLVLFSVTRGLALSSPKESVLQFSGEMQPEFLPPFHADGTYIPILVPSGRKLNINDVFIRFYHSQNISTNYHLHDISNLVNNSKFDVTKPTVIYCHGYVELVTDPTTAEVVGAYHKRGGWNILVLDWANLAYGDYISAMLNMPRVAKETGRAVFSMVTAGVMVQNLHLVGFSLGSHLQAGVARFMASKGMKIHRLTGLDPALPGFYPPLLLVPLHITAEDGHFVDIIHSDTSFYGTPVVSGHADFWPNGGAGKQPGCPPATVFLTDQYLCSHRRSCRYWAESVMGSQFRARKCHNYDTFLRGSCPKPSVTMGLHADTKLRGNFYLITAANSPFALEERGAL